MIQTPFHHPNSSKMLVTKQHSGIIVLMLSRLLPVSWQCHTVVSDRTVSNLSPHTEGDHTAWQMVNVPCIKDTFAIDKAKNSTDNWEEPQSRSTEI